MNKTQHYLLDIDNETNLCTVDWYAFSKDLNLKDENGLRTWLNTKDGVSVASQWPADARIQAQSKSIPPGAMLGNDEDVLLVNEDLKTVIAAICNEVAIEFLPFSVVDKKGKVIGEKYYVVNPLGTYDALDLMACNIHWDSNGNIYCINELILDKTKAATAPPLFRLQYAPNTILLGHSLALAMYEQKFSIWWYKQMYNDQPKKNTPLSDPQLPATVTHEQLSLSHRLLHAAKNGKSQIVEELLLQQPLLNLFDNPVHGHTALMHAAIKGDITILKKLIDAGAGLDVGDNENRTALYFAIQENKEIVVSALLQAGANPNIGRTDLTDPKKIIGSPLDTAIYLKHKKIVRLLLNHKADPNLKDHNGKIPFHDAKDEEMFQWLIDAGTDVNATSKYFSTPFHIIAGNGSLNLLKQTAKKVASINSQQSYARSTPLMQAAANGKLDNVRFLLEQGADSELKDNAGKTAIQYAFNNKQLAIVGYLAAQGVSADEKILQRVKHLQKERLEFAFDLYAKEVSDYIFNILQKDKKKIKFEPLSLQVNFDKDWQLEWFSLSGKTERQVYTYHLSADDIDAPAGYTTDTRKKLLAPFLKKYKLKEKDVLPDPLLCWQLYKTIHQQSHGALAKQVPLLLVQDNYNNSDLLSSIQHSLLASLSSLSDHPTLLTEYATLCLRQETEQMGILQLFNTRSNTYGIDNIITAIIQSAVSNVLLQQEAFTQPVSSIKLQYTDFGAMLPSSICVQFKKGKEKTWALDWPISTLPTHIDDFPNQDYLLPAFIIKHGLHDDVLGWGDLYQLPASLLRLEFLLAAQQIVKQLQEQGIAFMSDATALIGDGEDDCDDVAGYLRLTQQELRKKMANKNLLKAFAAMCYQTVDKQEWLQALIDKEIDLN